MPFGRRPRREPLDYETLWQKASRYCARQERAVGDVRRKLYEWGAPTADSDSIVAELYRLEFLDDRRYAHAFIRDKFHFNGWGRVRLRQELRQKQLSEAVVEELLEEQPAEDTYRTKAEEIAREQWQKVLRKHPEAAPYENRQRVGAFLQRRGFEPGIIYPLLEHLGNT